MWRSWRASKKRQEELALAWFLGSPPTFSRLILEKSPSFIFFFFFIGLTLTSDLSARPIELFQNWPLFLQMLKSTSALSRVHRNTHPAVRLDLGKGSFSTWHVCCHLSSRPLQILSTEHKSVCFTLSLSVHDQLRPQALLLVHLWKTCLSQTRVLNKVICQSPRI